MGDFVSFSVFFSYFGCFGALDQTVIFGAVFVFFLYFWGPSLGGGFCIFFSISFVFQAFWGS